MTQPADRRRYESPRRRQQALATRAAIADAARRRFMAHGWAGTRVRDVARDAGVAEPTVYAVYGNKAGLARALVDAVDIAARVPASAQELLTAHDGPEAQLLALIDVDCRLYARDGDVIALLHDAGRSEPELRTAYDDGRARADRVRREVFDSWPPRSFAAGVDATGAADTYAAICNISVHQVLAVERAWPPERIECWWRNTLRTLILAG